MPSYTTSLRLIQPATGEYSGSWGTQVNTGITALVDSSIAGTTSITMTAANYTLTTANGASDESRAMFLVLGGTPGAAREVLVPAVSKLYFVTNSTTGGFAQTVKTSAGSGISVPNGASMTLRCDGTDVVAAQNYFASMTLGAALPVASGGTGAATLTGVLKGNGTSAFTASNVNLASEVTGTLPVANGGTGAATFTANNVLLGNGTSALQVVAPGTAGNILTSNGTTWASSAPASAVSTISFGSTGLTPSTATSGAVSVAGTLATTNGGTGLTSFTSGGVVYASSSSALATGSALTFDGTNFSTTGTATATKFIPTGGSATGNGMYLPAANEVAWSVNGSEGMRLTSTGLGIGTSSPGVKLEVKSSAEAFRIEGTTARGSGNIYASFNDPTGRKGYWGYGASDDNLYIANEMNAAMLFITNNAERARLDSSGNLGLGVTPGTWYASAKAIEFAYPTYGMNSNGGAFVSFNARESSAGNWVYKSTDEANLLELNTDGSFRFFTAPSGTAGNAISFTQAMTLDASGQLSVGTPLTENSTGVYLLPTGEMRVKDSTENGTSQISIYNNNTTNDIEQFFVAMNGADVDIGNRRPDGGALKIFTLNTERARIDSSGRLLINATSIGTITDSQKFFLATTSETLSGTIARYSANASSPVLGFFKSRGTTVGSSAIVGANDTTGQIQFYADTASSLATTAVISSAVDGVTPTAGGILTAGRLSFATGDNVVSTPVTRLRIDSNGCFTYYQAAESAQNASATLTVANLRAKIITSNAAVTLTLPTGTDLETYTAVFATDTAFECVFIATTANAITIAANGNTTVGNLTVSGNTSGTFRFRKTNTNTFTVYRVA